MVDHPSRHRSGPRVQLSDLQVAECLSVEHLDCREAVDAAAVSDSDEHGRSYDAPVGRYHSGRDEPQLA